jgi:hypothetical protein
MNRIYLPHPIEIITKIFSWFVVILIDVAELLFKPIMRIGAKCYALFAVAAAVFSGYAFFNFDLAMSEAFKCFVALVIAFSASLVLVRLVHRVLTKTVRPPFARIIFETVAVSFRRPVMRARIKATRA